MCLTCRHPVASSFTTACLQIMTTFPSAQCSVPGACPHPPKPVAVLPDSRFCAQFILDSGPRWEGLGGRTGASEGPGLARPGWSPGRWAAT